MANEILMILKCLIENQEEIFSIRKLSQVRKINYKSAYNAVMKLEKERLVKLKRIGNTVSVSFSRVFAPLVFKAEYERRKELLGRNSDVKVIYSDLNKLKFPFILLLFGSHAKKTATTHSDIDLMLISDQNKAVEQKISLLPRKIHLTSLTPKEFMLMAASKEFSVVSEAIKNNLILIGIEDYYRLIEGTY